MLCVFRVWLVHASLIHHFQISTYVAVPCRNRRLLRRIFRSHCCVWSAVSLNFEGSNAIETRDGITTQDCHIYQACMSLTLTWTMWQNVTMLKQRKPCHCQESNPRLLVWATSGLVLSCKRTTTSPHSRAYQALFSPSTYKGLAHLWYASYTTYYNSLTEIYEWGYAFYKQWRQG